jgi:chloride channel 3/4/5
MCGPSVPRAARLRAHFSLSLSLLHILRLLLVASVSLIVIAVELTGAVPFLVPLAVATVAARAAAGALFHHGIYRMQIVGAGLPFLEASAGETYTEATPVAAVMTRAVRTLAAGRPITLADLDTLLHETKVDGFPIVDSDAGTGEGEETEAAAAALAAHAHVLGYIGRADLAAALDAARRDDVPAATLASLVPSASPPEGAATHDTAAAAFAPAASTVFHVGGWATAAPLLVTSSTPVAAALTLFVRTGARVALVVEAGRLVGILTRKDLVRHVMTVEKFPTGALRF